MTNINSVGAIGVVIAATVMLAACTTNLSEIRAGQPDALVWPEMSSANPLVAKSVRPALTAFYPVKAGASKLDVYHALGAPHYREGMAAVREWDYLFELPEAGGWTRCQFKVLFGEDMKVTRSYWSPQACSALLVPPRSSLSSLKPPAVVSKSVLISADVLFQVNSAQLSPDASATINRDVIAAVRESQAVAIELVGHTDRLGGTAHNLHLSLQRAAAVKAYLVAHGISPEMIRTLGLGASEPLSQCGEMGRAALQECLKVDRRVEIQIR